MGALLRNASGGSELEPRLSFQCDDDSNREAWASLVCFLIMGPNSSKYYSAKAELVMEYQQEVSLSIDLSNARGPIKRQRQSIVEASCGKDLVRH